MGGHVKIVDMQTWRGSRRSVIGGAVAGVVGTSALGRAAAQGAATPTASPVAGGTSSFLLVADRAEAVVAVYAVPGFEETGRLKGVEVAAHGGSILLGDGRLLFADSRAGEVVALAITEGGMPEIVNRVAADLGGNVSWMSADPDVRVLAVGSLKEDSPTQVVNLVDLAEFTNTAITFEMAAPEEIHPWLLGEPLHLHVAIGGQVDSFLLEDLLAGNREPLASVPVDFDSHGGLTDARNGRILYTTGPGAGFDVLDAAGPAAFRTQIPWDVDGLTGGRNARPRLLGDGSHVFGVMIPVLEDPTAWAENTVSNHITDIDGLTATRVPIATGMMGTRWGVSDRFALWAGYDAEGARAYLLDADPASEAFGPAIGAIARAVPTGAAVAGSDPTGAEIYPATAITADGRHGFVSIPGDGRVQVLDLDERTVIAEIAAPAPLSGGGYLVVVPALPTGASPVDLWGR